MDLMCSELVFIRHFKYARYATDVRFPQAFRPNGNVQMSKVYYSGKHKLYGIEVEVSVLLNDWDLG